jgi:hypothetical protein
VTDQREYRRTGVSRSYWSDAERPQPAPPTTLITHPRSAYQDSVPAWPTTMIEPGESELARWTELWRHPESAGWTQADQGTAVATLVRAEHRCFRRRPSAFAESEVRRLRDQLGLEEGGP